MSTNIDKIERYKLIYELSNSKEQKSITYKTRYREPSQGEDYYVYIANLIGNEGCIRQQNNEALDDLQELYNLLVMLYSRKRVPPKAKVLSITKCP